LFTLAGAAALISFAVAFRCWFEARTYREAYMRLQSQVLDQQSELFRLRVLLAQRGGTLGEPDVKVAP
jgi:hypothetical protein